MQSQVVELRQKAEAAKSRMQARIPQDEGLKLATIRRGDKEELRLRWKTFEGKPYVELRLWTRQEEGADWWPTKKGCTVRLGELPDLALGFAAALEELERGR